MEASGIPAGSLQQVQSWRYVGIQNERSLMIIPFCNVVSLQKLTSLELSSVNDLLLGSLAEFAAQVFIFAQARVGTQ